MDIDKRNDSFDTEEKIRKNIAFELHDSIGQQLSSIKFFVEALIRSGDVTSDSNLEGRLKDIIRMIQNTSDEVRRVALELRPKMLDDLGLLPTIDWLLRKYQKAHPNVLINRNLDIDENALSGNLKVTIFRILQECLNNIAKHAGATEVLVNLKQGSGAIDLLVSDNGVGFDRAQSIDSENYNSGLGIESIYARAELSGGQAQIDSKKGEGAKVRITWKRN